MEETREERDRMDVRRLKLTEADDHRGFPASEFNGDAREFGDEDNPSGRQMKGDHGRKVTQEAAVSADEAIGVGAAEGEEAATATVEVVEEEVGFVAMVKLLLHQGSQTPDIHKTPFEESKWRGKRRRRGGGREKSRKDGEKTN